MVQETDKPGLFLIERRRGEKRVLVNVPVEVTLEKSDGSKITERTFIEDVSDLGCRFTTRASVQQGDTVSLLLAAPPGVRTVADTPSVYKVMWVAPNGRNFTVGARLIQGEKLMEVE